MSDTPPLEGPQPDDLPDITAGVHETILKALDEAQWRGTAHVQAHAYIVRPKYPDLYDAMQRLIADQGTPFTFRGYTYKYVRVGNYKYWSIPPVLNREILVTEETADAPA